MPSTITLRATAKYGFGGKQYIARITGRDPKFTFAREFVGTKGGKRKEDSEYMIDEPGLYVTCDIDRKGNKDETYLIIEQDGDNLKETICDKESAMKIAKLMDKMSFQEAVDTVFPPPSEEDLIKQQIQNLTQKIKNSDGKDPEGIIILENNVGEWKKGQEVKRKDLVEWRQNEIKRLESLLPQEIFT